MARNKMSDLNDHLFAQLERLGDEELTEDQLKIELQRSKAISQVSKQIVDTAKTTISAIRLSGSGDFMQNDEKNIKRLVE